ncbi:YceD family protein [Plastorhodobacter daqingensis]|uniref:YceD family protein n=1 Tax=Plastorhodobacter daqingensis TaxID=1387281 RepID=A0ABW2UKH7_9RHOB
MTEASALPFSHPLRVADLPTRKPTRFSITPSAPELATIAAAIGADALRKVQLTGELRPLGRTDWELEAQLGATVVQPCIVTLAPVTTRIEEPVARRWLRDLPEPSGDEIEMPEDDTQEPLGAVIDLGAVLTEALALAMPLYPRAPDAELREAVFTEPGKAALNDESVKPFAGLAELRARLAGDGEGGPDQGSGTGGA